MRKGNRWRAGDLRTVSFGPVHHAEKAEIEVFELAVLDAVVVLQVQLRRKTVFVLPQRHGLSPTSKPRKVALVSMPVEVTVKSMFGPPGVYCQH